MMSFITTIIISDLFIFCLIPVSLFFHSTMVMLSFPDTSATLGWAIYGIMHAIYGICLLYFLISCIIYLVNKYKFIKGLEASKRITKIFYIINYVVLIINLCLPLLIAYIAFPEFSYNINMFFAGNSATILGVLLLQIIFRDFIKNDLSENVVKEEEKHIQKELNI